MSELKLKAADIIADIIDTLPKVNSDPEDVAEEKTNPYMPSLDEIEAAAREMEVKEVREEKVEETKDDHTMQDEIEDEAGIHTNDLTTV
jgi:hypothetical protein